MSTTAVPNFAKSGTVEYADLPHSCRCGARWSGSRTMHCGACHERTFTGEAAFTAHRKAGVCNPPESVGLTRIPGRAYEVWGTSSADA